MTGKGAGVYPLHFTGDWPEPYIYGVYTAFLAGKSPNIRSYTVYMYGFGQLYVLHNRWCPVSVLIQ
jgi:hypothetical protein